MALVVWALLVAPHGVAQDGAAEAGGSGWDRGMLDRTFPPLDPTEYTRRSRGGDQYPGADAGSVAPRSTELPAWLKMLKP